MNCDDSNLSAYLDNELPAAERRAVEAHLQSCPDCAATLKDLERVRTMLLTHAVPMGLHVPVLERIREEESPKTGRRAWRVALAAILLAVIAATVLYAFKSQGPGPQEPETPVIAIVPPDQKDGDLPLLAQNTTEPVAASTTPPSTEIAETMLPLTLAGTLISGDPQAVLVNKKNGEQHIYRPGDTVLDGVVLREILQSRVILDNHGVLESLTKGMGAIIARPSVEGRWQVAVLADGKVVDYGPVLRFTEVDGTLRVAAEGEEDYAQGRIEGRTLIVSRGPEEALSNLRGEFNNTFTEVVLQSPELSEALAKDMNQDGTESHSYALKLLKIEGDYANQDPRAIMQARNEEVSAMYGPLKAYALAHDGQFPAALAQLVSDYVQTLELYADREDRTVTYHAGLQLQEKLKFDHIPNCSSAADPTQALLDHEAKLQQIWGGPAPFAPVLIEVAYSNPEQVITLNIQGAAGGLGGVLLYESPGQEDVSEARWKAMAASDQNNLKQLGLVNKMFQNENCDFLIPGFCTVYPEYLTDPNILTSPWDEPGTVSYELLFPAVPQEELEALGAEALAAEGVSETNNPAFRAQLQSAVPIMYDITEIPAMGGKPATRNVLFLDGHVERISLDEFQKRVGPYLR